MIFKTSIYFITLQILQCRANAHFEWDPPNEAIDSQLHRDVIDTQLCDEQVRFIRENTLLLLQFLDAGIRTPRGVLMGNTFDLGNYHQCLGINMDLGESELQGKYCRIGLPLTQNISLPILDQFEVHPDMLRLSEAAVTDVERFYAVNRGAKALGGFVSDDARLMPRSPLSSLVLRLAVCIPRPCTTQQAMTSLIFNLTSLGFQYEDEFCRLPNDKPWVPGDYVAITLFSLLGLLALLSTCYELIRNFVLQKDPKRANSVIMAFSLYTNGRKFMTFSSKPGTIHCLDGIRALAMIWVLVGHTFSSESSWINPTDAFTWLASLKALWLTPAHITVDTFFTLSGLLLVYTIAGKVTSMQLLKNLHLFYLHRLLRMFPLLAAGVLLEATLFNHVSDGPSWEVADLAERCRTTWWSTLLHIQNHMSPRQTCVPQTWYLAIDVQLHILSPLVLVWVLTGKKRIAWTALCTALFLNLTAATVYNFIKEFPSGMMNFNRISDHLYYMTYYCTNTLTRAPAFLVGMIIGYILYLYSKEKPRFLKGQICLIWFCAFVLLGFVIYASYPILQSSWDAEKQIWDSLYNSFIRVIWAIGLGLMIFACAIGYGGPINWFLSLHMWKLLSRMSYALYIYHWALMVIVNSSAIQLPYFTPGSMMFKFLSHFALALIVSFILTLIVETPFNNFVKMILGSGYKKPSEPQISIGEMSKEENMKQS